MKWILIAVAVIVLLVGLVALVGAFVPREHSATCRARFRARPEALFALLADFDGYPRWRGDVKAVRRIEPVGGRAAFVEETRQGPRSYAVEASEPPRRLVLGIADETLPYGGSWTFVLAPADGGTVLSITEDGFVKPAIFRALARFVFGYHATMEQYLKALAKGLGEDVVVERVEPAGGR